MSSTEIKLKDVIGDYEQLNKVTNIATFGMSKVFSPASLASQAINALFIGRKLGIKAKKLNSQDDNKLEADLMDKLMQAMNISPTDEASKQILKDIIGPAVHDLPSNQYEIYLDKMMRHGWLPTNTEWWSRWGLKVRSAFTQMCVNRAHHNQYVTKEEAEGYCKRFDVSALNAKYILSMENDIGNSVKKAFVNGHVDGTLNTLWQMASNRGQPIDFNSFVFLSGMQVNSYPSSLTKVNGTSTRFYEIMNDIYWQRFGGPMNNQLGVHFGFNDYYASGGKKPTYEEVYAMAFRGGDGTNAFGCQDFANANRGKLEQLLLGEYGKIGGKELAGELKTFYGGRYNPQTEQLEWGEASKVIARILQDDKKCTNSKLMDYGLSERAVEQLAVVADEELQIIMNKELAAHTGYSTYASKKCELDRKREDIVKQIKALYVPESPEKSHMESAQNPLDKGKTSNAHFLIFGQSPTDEGHDILYGAGAGSGERQAMNIVAGMYRYDLHYDLDKKKEIWAKVLGISKADFENNNDLMVLLHGGEAIAEQYEKGIPFNELEFLKSSMENAIRQQMPEGHGAEIVRKSKQNIKHLGRTIRARI